MRKPGTILMVLALAVAAFWLGTRWHAAPAAAPAPDPAAALAKERATSAAPESQPVRTFRGPDGRPHMISYDPKVTPDDHDPVQVRQAVLEDMRNHPRNIVSAYDIPLADVELIVAGSKPMPAELLPAPDPPQPPAR